ncbi:MAG: MATE family efflux transporter [Cohaesibacter sp.]|nr:MATE family efflux transporter [Cohaesibacter sp.]
MTSATPPKGPASSSLEKSTSRPEQPVDLPPDPAPARTPGAILRQAGFLSLSGLFATSALLLDANMVAPLGDEILAGLGLSAGIYGIFMALLFGLGSAAQILLSQSASSTAAAGFYRRLCYCLVVGIPLALILTLLFRFNIHFLVDWLATTSGIGFAAKRYLGWMVYGLPISFLAYLLSLSFDVRHQSQRQLWGFAIEVPLNIALNAILIYGLLGFEALGIMGAAIATLIAQSARLFYLLILTAMDLSKAGPWVGLSLPSMQERLLFNRLALPVSLNVGALILGSQAYQLLFAQLPYQAYAALALMAPWRSIANVLGRGIALSSTMACADLSLGSKSMQGAIASIMIVLKNMAPKLALGFLGISMLVCALSLHVSGTVRLHFLTLIPLACLLVFVRSLSVSFGAVLRAIDQPQWVMRIQLVLQWGAGLPLLLVLIVLFDLPLLLAFGVLVGEETLRLALLYRRFRSLRNAQLA